MSDQDLRAEGTIRLADGRRLGFSEFGRAHGPAVLWFHGTPGSSHQVPPAARALARARGVRLIGIERPGYGHSTPHLYATVRDSARDVAVLADAIGVGRFAIVALSGGGPYALACAHQLAERVVAVGLLGGVAPGVGLEAAPGGLVGVAVQYRALLPLFREAAGRILRGGTQAAAPLAGWVAPWAFQILPPEDRAALADPILARVFVADVVRASRRWFGGPFYDATLFARPWGFPLAEVRVPVRLWQGAADRIVPLAHAVHLARLLPDALLSIRPREGHLGGLAAADEMIDALLACFPDRVASVVQSA